MNLIIPAFFRNTPFWLVLVIALTVLLTACQNSPVHHAYEGPAKAESKVASFLIPESFNLLFVDKKEFGSLLSGGGANVKVLPGSHEFVFKFQEFWDMPKSDDHERVESKPIMAVFESRAGEKYQLKFKKPSNMEEARFFAKDPNIEIIETTSNEKISASITYNLYTQSMIGGLIIKESEPEPEQPAPSPESEKTATTISLPVAAPAPSTISPTLSSTEETSNKTESKEDGRALDMLKYWWETASDNQKKAFQDWLTK